MKCDKCTEEKMCKRCLNEALKLVRKYLDNIELREWERIEYEQMQNLEVWWADTQ